MDYYFKKDSYLNNLLRQIYRIARRKRLSLYLVGGCLRDMLLKRKRPNPDIDFCLKRGAINFGKDLKKRLKAGFVILDKERGYCRLIKKTDDKMYTLDFTDFRGDTLEGDLLCRDFTINAMALKLEDLFIRSRACLDDLLVDPYGGVRDLKAKVIRIVHTDNFDGDPLRILRAFSLSGLFDFEIDKDTLRLIKLKHRKLRDVSGERIRDELFKILEKNDSFRYIDQMDRLKVLESIIPEISVMRGIKQGPYHHLDVWKHSLETLRQLEELIKEFRRNRDILDYLNENISIGRSRQALMKLGALLHDIGKPKAKRQKNGKTLFYGHERIGLKFVEEIGKHLRLSNDEIDSLEKMVLWHLRPGYLTDNERITARAIFRYYRDTGQESVSVLMISIADQRATRGPLTSKKSRIQHEEIAKDLIKEYFKRQRVQKPARLITGDDLIERFKLQPSPLIGRILRQIEELQAIGKIKTKAEALVAVKKYLEKLC
ncbi:MAG: HD domain-containing protein [Candidatus Omnitrophica bacterium]|nr:HD domain-containing protein [Candidatus Omnitrophota bacterium]